MNHLGNPDERRDEYDHGLAMAAAVTIPWTHDFAEELKDGTATASNSLHWVTILPLWDAPKVFYAWEF